jgi:hypothetical protein
MKPWIRTYSLGLITAAIAMAIAFWNTEPAVTEVVEEQMNEENMISQLEQQGYQVVTNDEWQAAQSTQEPVSDSIETETSMNTFSIDIVPGATTDKISQKLIQANIIEDVEAFESFMQENDYSRYIQIGQATLNSEMTHKEIAEAITSK